MNWSLELLLILKNYMYELKFEITFNSQNYELKFGITFNSQKLWIEVWNYF